MFITRLFRSHNYFILIEGGLKYELENVFYLQYRQHGFLERVLWFKKKKEEREREKKNIRPEVVSNQPPRKINERPAEQWVDRLRQHSNC